MPRAREALRCPPYPNKRAHDDRRRTCPTSANPGHRGALIAARVERNIELAIPTRFNSLSNYQQERTDPLMSWLMWCSVEFAPSATLITCRYVVFRAASPAQEFAQVGPRSRSSGGYPSSAISGRINCLRLCMLHDTLHCHDAANKANLAACRWPGSGRRRLPRQRRRGA